MFERCGEPGGVHETLLPYAVVSLVVFCFGFPVALAFLLLRNKRVIWEDQLLRCHGLGDSRRTATPETYLFRKKWGRLFYHFTPERWYWKGEHCRGGLLLSLRLLTLPRVCVCVCLSLSLSFPVVILSRKAGIAFVSLMFRRNVSYQLGILLLLLIVSYALQLRFQPYMSPADMKVVLQRHDDRAKNGNSFRTTINATLAKTLAAAKRDRVRARNASWHPSRNRVVSGAADFFVSYNTVEAVLLFCAMLVSLGGILFESGQLEASDYRVQRDLLSVLLVVIILSSLVYWLAVVAIEITLTVRARKPRKLTKGKSSRSMSGSQRRLPTERRQSLAFTAGLSPMFSAGAASAAATLSATQPAGQAMSKADVEVLRAGYKALQEENTALKQQLAESESTRARASQLGSYRSMLGRRAKKSFRPTTAAAAPGAAGAAGAGAAGAGAQLAAANSTDNPLMRLSRTHITAPAQPIGAVPSTEAKRL